MWWRNRRRAGLSKAAAALAFAALAGGCFQPLYGERSLTGAPALREQLSAVGDVSCLDREVLAIDVQDGVAIGQQLLRPIAYEALPRAVMDPPLRIVVIQIVLREGRPLLRPNVVRSTSGAFAAADTRSWSAVMGE